MIDLALFSKLFVDYGPWILILGGIVGGEEVVLALVILALSGSFTLWEVLVYVAIGEIIADSLIFLFARIKFFGEIRNHKRIATIYNKVDRFIIRISKQKNFLILLYSKFIYGTRIFTIVYLSLKNITLLRFIFLEIGVVLIWISSTIVFSAVIGSGILKIHSYLQNISLTIILIIFVMILFAIIRKLIKRNWFKKNKNYDNQ